MYQCVGGRGFPYFCSVRGGKGVFVFCSVSGGKGCLPFSRQRYGVFGICATNRAGDD